MMPASAVSSAVPFTSTCSEPWTLTVPAITFRRASLLRVPHAKSPGVGTARFRRSIQ